MKADIHGYRRSLESALKKVRDLSEILPTLLLNMPPFLGFAGQASLPYLSHDKKYSELKPIFETRKRMGEFVDTSISILK